MTEIVQDTGEAAERADMIRILSNLIVLFDNGDLKTRFDRIKNTMENDDEVRAWVERARKLVPAPKLEGDEAAKRMRNLDNRDQAIADNEESVVDLRKRFARQMAENGGAQGLINEFLDSNDPELQKIAIQKMRALRQAVETGIPPRDV